MCSAANGDLRLCRPLAVTAKSSEMVRDREPRVVVGVDGSAESEGALEWAASFAERFGRELTVVVAWHVPTLHARALSATDLEAGADDVAKSAVERVHARHPGLDVGQSVVNGAPGMVLVAESQETDLLVVGTHRTLGSVSSYCAHYASCSLVIVRERTNKEDESE